MRLPREIQQKCLFAEDKWGTTPYIAGRNCRLPQLGRTSPLEPRQSAATAVFGLEEKNNWAENCAVLVITQTVAVISYYRFGPIYGGQEPITKPVYLAITPVRVSSITQRLSPQRH